ncbi:MAG: hypothetical protein KBA54_06555, partial [Candidatus Cloacimonetes bacterium]|nr:hypothetical protein [Candidatus Cloacimonadota bacterium]
ADQTNVFTGGTNSVYRPNAQFTFRQITLATPEITIVPHETSGVNVSWPAVSGASQYQILRSLEPFGVFEHLAYTDGLSYNDTEVLDRAFYHVKALNAKQAKQINYSK